MKFWAIIGAIFFYCLSIIGIIFIPKILFGNYLNGWLVLVFAILLLLIEILLVLVVIIVLPKLFNFGKEDPSTKIPYANINEIRDSIFQVFINDNRAPVNLKMTGIRSEGIMTVGKENQKTEIYTAKFMDANPLSRDIYYVACRVDEPNIYKYETRKVQVTFEEEEQIFNKLANKLAKSPEKEKVTEIRVEKSPWGEDVIKTIREPEEDKNKLNGEEM